MREIPLVNGKGVALVDDEDFALVSACRWRLHNNGYAITNARNGARGATLFMHRLILTLADGEQTDHVNGNKLDNRRENLRRCTAAENSRNQRKWTTDRTSQYKGVYWSNTRRRWTARITVNGRLLQVGSSQYELAAAVAYDEAAREHFGAFAAVNFPKEGERAARSAA